MSNKKTPEEYTATTTERIGFLELANSSNRKKGSRHDRQIDDLAGRIQKIEDQLFASQSQITARQIIEGLQQGRES